MSRKKATPLAPVFNSLGEANSALARIGERQREIEMIEADLAERIALMRADADKSVLPYATEIAQLSLGIELYANGNRASLLEGDKKSVVLSAGVFGWRWTPPKVSAGRGGDAKVLERIQALGLTEYVRMTPELDKEALLRDKPAIQGVKYTQAEKFFIEPGTAVGPDYAVQVVVALPR